MKSHECWVYDAPKPMQDVLCNDCARGSKPRKGEKTLKKDYYVIAYCSRENAYGEMIPAEWFILNAPFSSREEAETTQAKIVESTKGTDAEWPEANKSAKIVHVDELAQYGLVPLN